MNAIGVCLMRLGKAREAVDVYQGMVMKPGCTWMRPEVPKLYKLNFATALLLKGTPAGCLGTLSERSQLSFLRRWDWRLSHVEPPNCQIELDFPPGEFFHSSAKPV